MSWGSLSSHVEGAGLLQHGEEGYGGRDLANDRADLLPDLHLALVGRAAGRVCAGVLIAVHFPLDVEDPPLQRVPALHALHHAHHLAHLAVLQPLVHLEQHLLQVRVELLVRGHQHGQPVLWHAPKGLWRVDASLVQNAVDAVVEELLHDGGGAT
eukprot:scaffold1702_cov253-Pinguiococcus_pyrenoidosus.AAC.5